MHGFRLFIEEQQDLLNKARMEAERLVANPNPRFKNGFGNLTELEELAAVINSAQKGFPDGTKKNALAISVDAPWFKNETQIGYWLLKMVSKLMFHGKIKTLQFKPGLYTFGKDAEEVNRLAFAQANHQDPKHWEYSAALGKLLGYSDAAVKAYIERSKKIRAGHQDVESIDDMQKKEF